MEVPEWCAGRDLNPHGISTTSPSNSRVCHSTTRARHRLKKIHASNEVPILPPYFCARRRRIIRKIGQLSRWRKTTGAMRRASQQKVYLFGRRGHGRAGCGSGAGSCMRRDLVRRSDRGCDVSDDAAGLKNAPCDMPGRGVGQKNRGREERSRSSPGDFRQQVACTGRTEDGLAGATETAPTSAPLPCWSRTVITKVMQTAI